MEAPVLELDTSKFEWPVKPDEDIIWRPRASSITSISPTYLRVLVGVGHNHSFCLTIDTVLICCIDIVFIGNGLNLVNSVISAQDRLYLHNSNTYLSRLVRTPVSDDDDSDSWLQEADHGCANNGRAFLQVLNPRTGEIEALVTWYKDAIRLEVIPASFASRKPHYGVRAHRSIASYTPYDGWLRIFLSAPQNDAQELIARLHIPADRRPTGESIVREEHGTVITYGGLVALGSSQGVVSIFDIEKAEKAHRVRERMKQRIEM
jgi:hypothetical protein